MGSLYIIVDNNKVVMYILVGQKYRRHLQISNMKSIITLKTQQKLSLINANIFNSSMYTTKVNTIILLFIIHLTTLED